MVSPFFSPLLGGRGVCGGVEEKRGPGQVPCILDEESDKQKSYLYD